MIWGNRFKKVFLFLAIAALPVLAGLDVSLAAAPRVLLKTSLGDITLELDPAKAPQTAANFLEYVKSGHYNGTIFHRVIPDFMIQGGGVDAGLNAKPTRNPIANEAANGLKNLAYTVAMARTSLPHSATAQFFINTVDNDFLNYQEPAAADGQPAAPEEWGYAVFGRVVEGRDVVDAIEKVPTGPRRDVPTEPVVIEEARIIE